MSTRAIWGLTICWCSGLLAGPHIPPIISALLIPPGLLATVALRSRRLTRIVLVAAVFLAAIPAGHRADFHLCWGPGGTAHGGHHGLANPSFRPLVFTGSGNRSEESDSSDELIRLPPRPEWASEPVWNLVTGLLLNRRDAIDDSWAAAFRGTGAAHILAVSGLHVGIIMAAIVTLLRLLRLSRLWSLCTALPIIWLYIIGIGLPPSAVRAGCMATIGTLALTGRGRIDAGRTLATAVLALLIISPALLASVGFQLSVAAMIGIVTLLDLPGRDEQPRSGARRIPGTLLRVTLAAQAGILPLQVLLFGTVSPWTVLVNLAAVPLLGLWLPTAAAALVWSLFALPGMAVVGALCEGLGRVLLWWIALCRHLPAGLLPVPAWCVLPALVILPCVRAGGFGRPVAIAAAMLVLWGPLTDREPRLSVLDVGQGDAIVIESFRPRRVAVVDAGYRFDEWDAGRDVVAPYLHSRAVERIDLLIATHTDGDHIGGMRALARAFPVGAFLRGSWKSDAGGNARRLRSELAAAGVPEVVLERGDRLRLGRDVIIDVCAGAWGRADVSEANNSSLVLLVTLAGKRILLTGDLEISGEERLRPMWGHLSCDILKVPHHGSGDALSPALLRAASPALAVVSVGRRNRHGHPAPGILARLSAAGCTVWRTDLHGACVITARR